MDREQWKLVLAAVKRAARRLPRDRRLRFADWLVAAMYLWAVAHDRRRVGRATARIMRRGSAPASCRRSPSSTAASGRTASGACSSGSTTTPATASSRPR